MENKKIIDGIDVRDCACHYSGWSYIHRDTRDMCDLGHDKECKPKDNQCHFYVKNLELQLEAYKIESEKAKQLKSVLEVIAGRPCFNPNDCNGHCLPNCKWNAHKLAQKALGNDF